MPVTHIGDLSRNYVTRLHSARLKSQLTQLTQEVGTGMVAQKTRHLRGNIAPLTAIERSIEILTSHQRAGQEAKNLADSKQTILANIQDLSAEFASALLPAAQSHQRDAFDINASDATTHLRAIISDLNSSVGGRALFSGTEVDTAALASADTILAEIRLAATGSTTISDFLTAIDTWFFASGGGFETTGYLGGANDLVPMDIGANKSVDLSQRADDTALRNIMRDLAVVALSNDAAFEFNIAELKSITTTASNNLHGSMADLTTYRAALGTTQSHIDTVLTQNSAQKTAQMISRNALIAVDPFETATKLENVQFQMESLYAVTARLSRLSLVAYLR
ncbi:MAG: flagellin [Cognatishimia sp.]